MFNSLFSTHVNKTHVFSVGTGVKPDKTKSTTDNTAKMKKEDADVQD